MLTPVRVRVAHPLNFLLGLVEQVGHRAGVADVPVTLECNTDLNRLVAPQVAPDIPAVVLKRSAYGSNGFGWDQKPGRRVGDGQAEGR